MMEKIIWSEHAKLDYWENIDYLLEQWSKKEAMEFIEKVNSILEVISSKPKAFQKANFKGVHGVTITPQIKLFYKVSKNDTIELIRFWNNYQNPKKLKL